MSYSLQFELPGLPKMSNQSLRQHWRASRAEGTKWKDAVGLKTIGKRPSEPLLKAKLTLIRCSSVEPDYDGLVSSFKHVIDGLVKSGILVSDKMSHIGAPAYLWELTAPKKGKIKVRIEEVNS